MENDATPQRGQTVTKYYPDIRTALKTVILILRATILQNITATKQCVELRRKTQFGPTPGRDLQHRRNSGTPKHHSACKETPANSLSDPQTLLPARRSILNLHTRCQVITSQHGWADDSRAYGAQHHVSQLRGAYRVRTAMSWYRSLSPARRHPSQPSRHIHYQAAWPAAMAFSSTLSFVFLRLHFGYSTPWRKRPGAPSAR